MERGEIDFFLWAGRLKRIGRRGWTERGIEIPETVADHTYRTALLSLYYGKKFGMDTEKLLAISLLHDINETISGESGGDKFKDVPEKDKLSKGKESLATVTKGLEKKVAKEYLELWLEENAGKSKEGKFVRELNLLELAFQALEYELSGHPGERLEDMWEYAKRGIKDPRVKKVLAALEAKRPKGRKKK